MKEIVLASSSKYRAELLKRIGLKFSAVSPQIDEDKYKSLYTNPVDLSANLSKLKGKDVFRRFPDKIVISGDQVAHIDCKILGKPITSEEAIKQLNSLNGQEHELVTSISVFSKNNEYHHTDITRLKMRNLSLDEILRYVEIEKPFYCAGSYKFESLGITLFESVETKDSSSITGIPLLKLVEILTKLGISIP